MPAGEVVDRAHAVETGDVPRAQRRLRGRGEVDPERLEPRLGVDRGEVAERDDRGAGRIGGEPPHPDRVVRVGLAGELEADEPRVEPGQGVDRPELPGERAGDDEPGPDEGGVAHRAVEPGDEEGVDRAGREVEAHEATGGDATIIEKSPPM